MKMNIKQTLSIREMKPALYNNTICYPTKPTIVWNILEKTNIEKVL